MGAHEPIAMFRHDSKSKVRRCLHLIPSRRLKEKDVDGSGGPRVSREEVQLDPEGVRDGIEDTIIGVTDISLRIPINCSNGIVQQS